jgi:hypothetical protein
MRRSRCSKRRSSAKIVRQDLMLKQVIKILNVVQKAAKEDTAKELSDLLGDVMFNEMDMTIEVDGGDELCAYTSAGN